MNGKRALARRAFTLVELLVVIGLIAVLISLFLPVLSKARAAANATVCAGNLQQLGRAWTMYVAENKGRLPDPVSSTPTHPDLAWRGYWLGIMDSYKARGSVWFCPSAGEVLGSSFNRGYGTATFAWTGRFAAPGSGIRFNASTYREGSYGYNQHLTAGGGFGPDGDADKITAIKNLSEVPLVMDCAYADTQPSNKADALPAQPPPNLRGDTLSPSSPQHWRFLLARHGRAINFCMADGSARRVSLEETYQLQWKGEWTKYRLSLPIR